MSKTKKTGETALFLSLRKMRLSQLFLFLLLLFVTSSCSNVNINNGMLDSQVERELRAFSDAPLQVVAVSQTSLSNAEAFQVISIKIHEWFPLVEEFQWDHSHSENLGQLGNGSIRRGLYKGNEIIEVVRIWHPSRYYIYQIDLEASQVFMPIKNHIGIFIVENDGHGGSIITWKQYFDSQIPLVAGITAWVMQNYIVNDAFDNLSKKFK